MSQDQRSLCKAVIGLGFGDEGKGKVVNHLAGMEPYGLGVRYSGGAQAAHRVFTTGGFEHVFSTFSSASNRGHQTYLTEDFILNPIYAYNEYVVLKRSIESIPRLIINPLASIAIVYDLYDNQNDGLTFGHGTCGHGINSIRQREMAGYKLIALDFSSKQILHYKVKAIIDYYQSKHGPIQGIEFDLNDLYDKFHKVAIIGSAWQDRSVIYESSQGLMLDKDYGYFPNVTHASVGLAPVIKYAEAFDIFLVTRAYQTRHGNGPILNSGVDFKVNLHKNEKNVNNKHQGKFRTSILNLDQLKYAYKVGIAPYKRKNDKLNVVVTCLDHIKDNYSLIDNGMIKTFKDSKEFCHVISSGIGHHMASTYMSYSEYSEQLDKI